MANLNVAISIVGKDRASGPVGAVVRSLTGLKREAGGVLRPLASVTRGLGRLGLAGLGLDMIVDMAHGAGRALGVHLNSALENTRAQIQAFTKDAALTERVLAAVRAEADETPFGFRELATATGGLIPAAKQAREPLMDLVDTAEILAASNPAEGLEGAAFSLREAVSGDFTSIIERFNLPRTAINRLKEEGLPALEIVRRAMGELGFDMELVANQSRTLTGRWSSFTDVIDGISRRLSAPLFEQLKSGLEGAQRWFDRNRASVDLWATVIGERLGQGVALGFDWIGRLGDTIERNGPRITAFGTGFIAAVDTVLAGTGLLVQGVTRGLGAVLDVVMDVGTLIYDALQWLNPFARHSPSLVEQVDDGVDFILDKYMRLGGAARPIEEVAEAVQDLGSDTTAAGAGRLKGVVEALKDRADDLKDALSDAQSRLRDLVATPIQGEGALADAIFGTEQEIARRRLRLLELQEMRGPGVRSEARRIAREIDQLERQGQKLRLQDQIQFDPLRRQIEQAANPQEEQPFDTILQGVRDARSDIETLEPAVTAATAAWEAQAKALKSVADAMDEASGGGPLELGIDGALGTVDDLKGSVEEWKTKLADARTEIEERWAPAFDGLVTGVDKVSGGLEKLNGWLDTIQAKGFGAWLQEQLADVDWNQVGQDIGQALPSAINSGLDALETSTVGQRISEKLGEINWIEVGENVGSKAFPLAMGVVDGFIQGIIDTVRTHPAEVGLFIATSFFTPTKVLGPVAKALGKIPIAGQIVNWAVMGLNKAGGPVRGRIGTFLGETFGTFGTTFRKTALPKMEGGLLSGLRSLGKKALEETNLNWLALVENIAAKVAGAGPKQIVGAWRGVWGAVDDFFVGAIRGAPKWGDDLIKGFGAGVTGAAVWLWDTIAQFVRNNVIDPVRTVLGIRSPSTVAFGMAGDVVQGMIDGLANMAQSLWDAAKDIGGNLWGGIVDGFSSAKQAVGGIVSGIRLPEIDLGGSSGRVPGFARGGSFMVGGAGGSDSQMVVFRASPNERVTVETPEQQRGRGQSVEVNVTVQAGAVQVTGDVRSGFGQRLGEAIGELVRDMVVSEELSLMPARASLPGAR